MSNPVSDRITLRPAGSEDCLHLWQWRNEQATREASFNTEFIPFEEHERWFTRKLSDPHLRIFIAVDSQSREIGYARFDIMEGQAEISVSIDKDERGKGHGVAVIKSGCDHLLMTEPVHRIIAHIKPNNPSSVIAFERAGFTFRGYTQIADIQALEMIYEG